MSINYCMPRKCTWSEHDLFNAVLDNSEKRVSFTKLKKCMEFQKVPYLCDHVTGKVEFGSKLGPASILTIAKQKIAQYAIKMSCIGCGLIRE